MTTENRAAIDPVVLDEAIAWKACLSSGVATPDQQAGCLRWRNQNPEHELVWQRLSAIDERFQALPAGSSQVLNRAPPFNRRTVLKSLLVFAVATPVAITATDWSSRRLFADYVTKTGQRKRVTLPDGTQMHLNTDTAVAIQFDETYRRIVLQQGEITISTAPDPNPVKRDLIVSTARGEIKALGTYFWVRDGKTIDVAVFDGATHVTHYRQAASRVIEKGYQVSLMSDGFSEQRVADENVLGWVEGNIIAQGMRLDRFLAELERHFRGIIVCEDRVADLRLSGVFPLNNKDNILNALEQSLPVRISSFSRYWVRVSARQ